MKFLCVPCDQPMKLADVAPPDRGSLSVRYVCPECGYEMAMLTNPYETQVVQSLGVRVGPEGAAGEADTARAAAVAEAGVGTTSVSGGPGPGAGDGAGATGTDAESGGGRCPFASLIPGSDTASAETAGGGGAGPSGGGSGAPAGRAAAVPVWTDQASARMKAIPAFVRPMARTGIEKFARDRGYATIDEKVLEEARAFFGM